MASYKHSGKLGDLIYALPAIRAAGGGSLYINVSGDSLGLVGFNAIRPLLESQTYISEVRIWEGEPVQSDLDMFRAVSGGRGNLVSMHLEAMGLPPGIDFDPWLSVPPGALAHQCRVLMARSQRSRLDDFWVAAYTRYRNDCAFVGTGSEHAEFERRFGPIQYHPTKDLLELAQLISQSELFVGTQSCPYAIATGLGCRAVLEVDVDAPNCLFHRPGARYVSSSRHVRKVSSDGLFGVECRDVATLPEREWGHWVPNQLHPASLGGTSVIVLTYNSEATIRSCLEAVIADLRSDDEVILVDNCSTDQTVSIVDAMQQPIRVIQNSENLGFSAGCNVGIRQSRGRFVALLNPDVIVQPGWLEDMEGRFTDPSIGAVGPVSDNVGGFQFVSYHLNPNDTRPGDCLELAAAVRASHAGRSMLTRILIGFCLLVPREVLNKVGLLDEDLFLGSDDLEFSLRLRTLGYQLLIARDVFVHHVGGASFAQLEGGQKAEFLRQSTRALVRKLATAYEPKALPTSMELWDADFIPDEIMIECLRDTHPGAVSAILESEGKHS